MFAIGGNYDEPSDFRGAEAKRRGQVPKSGLSCSIREVAVLTDEAGLEPPHEFFRVIGELAGAGIELARPVIARMGT